jgi:4-diphosphocytidyl-2C-methyl-D-erythritol kinase
MKPALRDLFERAAETRPLLVRVSGSGSAIIAIYRSEGDRDAAARSIGEQTVRLIRTATRTIPAPIPAAEEG